MVGTKLSDMCDCLIHVRYDLHCENRRQKLRGPIRVGNSDRVTKDLTGSLATPNLDAGLMQILEHGREHRLGRIAMTKKRFDCGSIRELNPTPLQKQPNSYIMSCWRIAVKCTSGKRVLNQA